QSFAATCSKLDLDVGESFLRILHDPTHNIVREGLRGPAALPMLPIYDAPPMLPAPRPATLPMPAGEMSGLVPLTPEPMPRPATLPMPAGPSHSITRHCRYAGV
ncbi:MAG: hypothetical protein J4G04_07355, partial [Nitrosopumilaceae archaeon]|nr:hypothetical protein [Nitrosopumilaceae archaeon]